MHFGGLNVLLQKMQVCVCVCVVRVCVACMVVVVCVCVYVCVCIYIYIYINIVCKDIRDKDITIYKIKYESIYFYIIEKDNKLIYVYIYLFIRLSIYI